MARKRGLVDFNLALIRYLMRAQSKDTTALAEEIEVSRRHLSGVLNRHRPLSDAVGKQLSIALGVDWDLIKKPESVYMRDLMAVALVEFLQSPGKLDWKNSVRLADKMGFLSAGLVDTGEPTEAQVEDEDLLELRVNHGKD